jgi:hypothetical protein
MGTQLNIGSCSDQPCGYDEILNLFLILLLRRGKEKERREGKEEVYKLIVRTYNSIIF